jgi:hypothetical protein
MVEEDQENAAWKGGFTAVEEAWNAVGPELMTLTQDDGHWQECNALQRAPQRCREVSVADA